MPSRAPDEAVYGLGHFVERHSDGSTAVGHDGRNQAGFRARFLMRPQSGDGIVCFSNSGSGLALDRVVCLWGSDVAKVEPVTTVAHIDGHAQSPSALKSE
ncbi:hypothetical protein [Corallococcus exiguus]|uniref:hypothetical protein n=1 Tax=Corallococcus exiguus TaxID=83462 RepID=UPI002152F960|nr:hypothetical protein [Corallococcus exiguus]